MAEWIGHFIAGWPTWAVILVIVFVIFAGIIWALTPWTPGERKYEWPEGAKKGKTQQTQKRKGK